jgi:hypothetical protein
MTTIRMNLSRKSLRLPLVAVVGVLVMIIIGVSSANSYYSSKASNLVLGEAKKQCSSSKQKVVDCESLYTIVEVPDWGPDSWIVDVRSKNDNDFSASGRVQFDFFTPHLIDYAVNE